VIILGLTGSIGMGKTTTAAMFRDAGAAVYDADAAVHALYAPGGEAAGRLRRLAPEAMAPDGGVDRAALARWIEGDPSRLKAVEALVHPLVAQGRAVFLQAAEAAGAPVAVLDIPLLFEVAAEAGVDAIVVVSAPADVQRTRVLARPGMDEARFALLLARQLPDAEKRARADFVIHTGLGMERARAEVAAVMATVLQPGWKPK
jgi:dephospho-CoA kinase